MHYLETVPSLPSSTKKDRCNLMLPYPRSWTFWFHWFGIVFLHSTLMEMDMIILEAVRPQPKLMSFSFTTNYLYLSELTGLKNHNYLQSWHCVWSTWLNQGSFGSIGKGIVETRLEGNFEYSNILEDGIGMFTSLWWWCVRCHPRHWLIKYWTCSLFFIAWQKWQKISRIHPLLIADTLIDRYS